jgi:hypothetical protein
MYFPVKTTEFEGSIILRKKMPKKGSQFGKEGLAEK